MSNPIRHTVPVNPAQRLPLAALYGWLLAEYYSQHAREAIIRHVAREGTLEGSRHLEPCDLELATEVYCDAFEEVPMTAREWDEDDGRWTPNDIIRLEPADVEHDDITPDRNWTRRPDRIGLAGIMPISGGAPEGLAGDRRDFELWLDSLDATLPPYMADDAMAFPPKADPLADRRRWAAQSAAAERSFLMAPDA